VLWELAEMGCVHMGYDSYSCAAKGQTHDAGGAHTRCYAGSGACHAKAWAEEQGEWGNADDSSHELGNTKAA